MSGRGGSSQGAGIGMGAGRALVTGASRGIGKAISEALIEQGWSVTGTCRNPRSLAAKERVAGMRYVALDLGNEKSIASLIRAVGEVDLLVNNAGESPIGPAEEIPIKMMRRHFDVNFFGPALVMQGFLPAMRRKQSGMIIFIGSIRGESPTPFSSVYAASKAAIRAFGECVRMELLGTRVRVAVVTPWYIRTSLPQERFIQKGSPYAEALQGVSEVRERMISRSSDPRVVADAVLRLLKSSHPAPVTVVGRPFLTFFLHHAPRALVARMSARMTGMRPLEANRALRD